MDTKKRPGFASLLDALRWDGRTDRMTYAIAGIVLVAVKYNLDRAVAYLFGRGWSGINYVVPNETFSLRTLPPGERGFYLTLAAVAVPFVVVGILLTLRRLRDIGLSPWLFLFFFVPVANLFFFFVISLLPSLPDLPPDTIAEARETVDAATGGAPTYAVPTADIMPQPDVPETMPDPTPTPWWTEAMPQNPLGNLGHTLVAMLPENPWGSALITSLLLTLIALPMVGFGANVLQNYGWGLFVGAPFCLGLAASVLHGIRAPRTYKESIGVGLMALLMVCIGLLIAAAEGAICILMALPIAIPINLLGSSLGYCIQSQFSHPDADVPGTTSRLSCSILVLLPLFMFAESLASRVAVPMPVHTSVIINAPPEKVWPNVIAFPALPPLDARDPSQWLFFSGIAYPKGAHIEGNGVGAVRYCEFSTGPFVEPITTWDSPHLLAFRVTRQPAPMHELSPYPDIHPPHLDNFLVSQRGQFLLTPLPGGRTLLEGTTWYRNRMWPYYYWRLWSDNIIHQIHRRVLEQVKSRAEHSSTSSPP